MARAANASIYSPQLLAIKYFLVALGSFGVTLFFDQTNGLGKIFIGLGPTFVKLGQELSTRLDLCPPKYLEELTQLRDAFPTFPDEEAFLCIEKELGLSLESIFSSISPYPIAAASLGQVYKARLKYSNQLVAIKVGLRILINKYVDIITSDVVALINEFAKRVYQELNYVHEAQNARRFKKLYADKAEILVPDIFWDYTSGKVLMKEWVEGAKINEQEAIEKQGLKLLELVNTGIQCSFRQLLEYGYFHADPHPSNLLATPDGKLAFLDFGMMSETPEEARFAIIGHFVHLVNRYYEAMACDYYALDFLSLNVNVTPIVPTLRNFFDDTLNYTVSELNFKTLVDGLGAVLYQYPFNVRMIEKRWVHILFHPISFYITTHSISLSNPPFFLHFSTIPNIKGRINQKECRIAAANPLSSRLFPPLALSKLLK
ncbi:hypothetical protein UlMin_033475 [Ulmus minor]